MNLNEIQIQRKDDYDPHYQRPTIAQSADRKTTVYFDNLAEHLIEHIHYADAVLGCVAWLTHFDILDALAEKQLVSIVVQKEDFLRPDTNTGNAWARELRTKYDKLKHGLSFGSVDHKLFYMLRNCQLWYTDPIRCVGNHNADKLPAFPRSHHKFVLFCERYEISEGIDSYAPYAVWTGSFNFTKNAVNSFENALFMTDSQIVNAYLAEYAYVFGLSESLDWTSQWVAPELTIGT